MGILIPSKVGLVLRGKTATGQQLADAVTQAATVEPPLSQRKLKYRKAPGIGAGTIYQIDPANAAREHGLDTTPAVAVDVDLCGAVVRVLLIATNQGAEAMYMCVSLPLEIGTPAVDGFPWAEALADRTADFLRQNGIDSEIGFIKARG